MHANTKGAHDAHADRDLAAPLVVLVDRSAVVAAHSHIAVYAVVNMGDMPRLVAVHCMVDL